MTTTPLSLLGTSGMRMHDKQRKEVSAADVNVTDGEQFVKQNSAHERRSACPTQPGKKLHERL
jgi:hypothetical protein